MNGYLLDTNVCIAWMKNNSSVIRRVMEAGQGHIWLCAPVKAELFFGAAKSERPAENRERLGRFFQGLVSRDFDDAASERCGELRATLHRAGTPIGPYDLQIAAIALTGDLTLVTNNTREFARVPNLTLVDWLD